MAGKRCVMASIDIQEYAGPRQDRLGLGLFIFHLLVSLYVLTGWMTDPGRGLALYVFLLPAIAAQWRFNRGSCVINNFESWLRNGRWHDSANREEGAFLLMLSEWLFRTRPAPRFLDRLSYSVLLALWLLGITRLGWLTFA